MHSSTSSTDACRTGDYDQLARSGHYSDSPQGLWGKYDNVRRFWENQISRFIVAPAVERVRSYAASADRGARILDLGCGSGEGWELLTSTSEADADIRLFAADEIDSYHGIDLSPAMIDAAHTRFAHSSRTRFDVGDLTDPRSFLGESYDLYYNSYGSLSHLDDAQLAALLDAIAVSQPDACTVIVDVHGQFSPEWPIYWGATNDPRSPRMRPYDMSWLYPPAEAASHRHEFSDYRIRYWGGRELESFLRRLPRVAPRIASLRLIDRSIAVGRHVDTGVFNPQATPTRRAVNRLFEFNERAPTADLRFPEIPLAENPDIAAFHSEFAAVWNACIGWFAEVSAGREDGVATDRLARRLPEALRPALAAIASAANGFGWLQPGAPVANLIQPQFALFLRQLEFQSQRGLGCGHGLIAVLDLAGRV